MPEADKQRGTDHIGRCAGISTVAVRSQPLVKLLQGLLVIRCRGGATGQNGLCTVLGFLRQWSSTFASNQAVWMRCHATEVSVHDTVREGPATLEGFVNPGAYLVKQVAKPLAILLSN